MRKLRDLKVREISILFGNVRPAVPAARVLAIKGQPKMTPEEQAVEQLKTLVGQYLFRQEQEVPGLAEAIARMAVADCEEKLETYKKSLEQRAIRDRRELERRQFAMWNPRAAQRWAEGTAIKYSAYQEVLARRSFEN